MKRVGAESTGEGQTGVAAGIGSGPLNVTVDRCVLVFKSETDLLEKKALNIQ